MSTARAKLLKKTDKDFSDSTEKFITFLEMYVELGDPKKAWLEAGYSPSNVNKAMSKIRDNWRLVEKLVSARIAKHVPFALNQIVELAENGKQESVRLKACQDILYRAGYDRPMEIITTEKNVDQLKNKELEDELTQLLARANKEANPNTLQ